MALDTVIFDMDGLLIDSEPLWAEAADEILKNYQVSLIKQQYIQTTGLRTKEFLLYWFDFFKIDPNEIPFAEKKIFELVLHKVARHGKMMPGVHYIIDFFHQRNFKIGVASSSPQELIDLVADKLQIKNYLHATASAEELPYGKPHPQVYLNCAAQLQAAPANCICFEDSFNGMIAAKAAKMKCVVVPEHQQHQLPHWAAADLKLSSLQNFSELHFNNINQ
jgi:sugar-phosphatase